MTKIDTDEQEADVPQLIVKALSDAHQQAIASGRTVVMVRNGQLIHDSTGVPDSNELTDSWANLIDELLQFRTLPNDWDGEGTEAPQPALVDWAITLAQSLQAKNIAPPDRVHVSVNSTVYFEWHSALGYCEIEVVSPIEAECRWIRKGSSKTEEFIISHQS
jgi:hypothetical protein